MAQSPETPRRRASDTTDAASPSMDQRFQDFADPDSGEDSYLRNIFKRRLESARKRIGMQQNVVAGAVGVSASTYSKWESIKSDTMPPVHKIGDLANLLRVTADHLLGLDTPTQALPADELELLANFRSLSLQDRSCILYAARRFKASM